MADFGCKTIGANSSRIDQYAYYCKFEAPENGQATSITWYLDDSDNRDFKVALFDSALNLLAQGVGLKGGDGWTEVVFAAPVAIVGGQDYWFGGRVEEGASVRCWYDAGDVNQGAGQTITYADFPSDPMVPGYAAREYSVYCTYTPAGPPAGPPRAPAVAAVPSPHF